MPHYSKAQLKKFQDILFQMEKSYLPSFSQKKKSLQHYVILVFFYFCAIQEAGHGSLNLAREMNSEHLFNLY
jgi:hypothetical protein